MPATSTANAAKRALTLPLRRELVRAFPERPFALRFWDGSVVPATVGGSPEFHARSPAALGHFVRAPGAGAERTRIWRLYLRAARRGFDVGLTSVYQVLASRR